MRISDWSSDVCSSDLLDLGSALVVEMLMEGGAMGNLAQAMHEGEMKDIRTLVGAGMAWSLNGVAGMTEKPLLSVPRGRTVVVDFRRSEEHTSELPSLMRISYAVFCLKQNTTHHTPTPQ